ncbi:MAG: hypothetical protein U0869_09890 [Chloroflexota bacterium]
MARAAAVAATTAAEIDDAFASVGLRAPRGFGGMLRDALRLVVTEPPVADPISELTDAELTELRAAGLRTDAPTRTYADAVARTAARTAAIMAGSGTVEETAKTLGVTPARVRQLLGERALFGIRTADGWLVPRFQLADGAPLPGLRAVVSALPAGIHPVAFHTWFTTPAGPLRLDDQPVSPRDWLASGGPVEPVAQQAAAL